MRQCERELQALRVCRRMKGEVQVEQAKVAALQRENKLLQSECLAAQRRRNHVEGAAEGVAEQVHQLTAALAASKVEVGALKGQVYRASKKEAAAARAAASALRAVASKLEQTAATAAAAEQATETWARRRVRYAQSAASERVQQAQARLEEADDEAAEARQDAEAAKTAAVDTAALLAEAREAREAAQYQTMLAKRREARAQDRAELLEEQLKNGVQLKERTADQWEAMSREAVRKARQRDRDYLRAVFASRDWSMADLAAVLAEAPERIEAIFASREVFELHYEAVSSLMKRMEVEDYGIPFGLFLHYELHLTLSKILQITQAACKRFKGKDDRYLPKVLLRHRWRAEKSVTIPRLAPPRSKLEPVMRDIESRLGVIPLENGRLAYRPFSTVVQDLLARDCGRWSMPALPFFLGGSVELPLVVSFDATGYGSLQFNTICIRNPYAPQSAALLRIIGLGNCDDNKPGTTALMGRTWPRSTI